MQIRNYIIRFDNNNDGKRFLMALYRFEYCTLMDESEELFVRVACRNR